MRKGLSEARYQCHRSGRKGDARKRSGMEAGGTQRNARGDAENGTRRPEIATLSNRDWKYCKIALSQGIKFLNYV